MVASFPEDSSLLSDLDTARGIIDAVPQPVFLKDDQHRFVTLNQTMCDLMGRPFEQLVGKTDHDFVPKDQADVFRANDQRVLDTGEVNENEELFTDGEGGLRTIVTRKKRLVLPNGARLVVGCISDITEFRRAEAQIRHNAEHDYLTGLANRALFRTRLHNAIADRSAACALLVVDLDGFKTVNDMLGHAAGDNLLIQAAGALTGLAGPDDLVARLGGDEFAIIQRADNQPEAASALAAAIVERLSRPIFLRSERVHFSASVGVAFLTPGTADAEAFMRHADLALYRAKRDGRNAWRIFEAEMEASYLVNRFIEDDLRSALSRNEFSVAYQPFVRTRDREIAGFEAAPRWDHPDRGPIAYTQFMPIAEATGVAEPLGEWVMRQACGEAAGWPDHVRVAVNVTPSAFDMSALPERIRSVLRDTGIDPRRLDLEVSEAAIAKDLPAAERVIAALRELGARVVLDDFGAGFRSLQILKSLPFDGIKVDRSLTRDVGKTPQADAVMSAVLQLSRTLKLGTAAEGVENERQLRVLRREQCEEVQGHLFGEPAGAPAFHHEAPALSRA
jgi:diguanylate cyclase (GGDEF)-like protein/PAS domain S-box-containing protein